MYAINRFVGCIESFKISVAHAGDDEAANVAATTTVMEPRKSRLEQSPLFSFANRGRFLVFIEDWPGRIRAYDVAKASPLGECDKNTQTMWANTKWDIKFSIMVLGFRKYFFMSS